MSEVRWDITAVIEPGQTEGLAGGGWLQLVSVILSDPEPDPDDPPTRWLAPAVVTLNPREARELAFCLLELAEQAERISQR
jgi:hypothetical protein